MLLPIPVKPYVRQLLIQHYGKEPIAVRANSDLGQIFLIAVVRKAYLNATFRWQGQSIPGMEGGLVRALLEDVDDEFGVSEDNDGRAFGKKNQNDLVLDMPEGLVVLNFALGGKFNKGVILPDMLEQIGKAMESYAKIYMKGFSHGYRTLFNSSRNSALVFHQIFEFDEDVLTLDNCEKIIQRENQEMKDPIDVMNIPRKSYRFRKAE